MKTPVIHVFPLRPIRQGNLRAFASIKIGPLVIHDFRIIQQSGQRAYVAAPQIEYEQFGKRKFKPLLGYPDEWRDAINSAVLAAWEKEQSDDAQTDRFVALIEQGLSPCCEAELDESRVIKSGRYKGHGQKVCTLCGRVAVTI